MPRIRCHYAFAVAFSWLSCASGRCDIIDIHELRRIVTEQRQRVHSMSGTGSFEAFPDKEAKDRSMMRGMARKVQFSFAWSDTKRRYADNGLWYTRDMKDAHVESINVWDGQEFRRRTGKQFVMQKAKSGFADLSFYTFNLLWPMKEDDITEAQRNPDRTRFLPYLLQSTQWRVKPNYEMLDNTPCLVIERKDVDWRLYFDSRRGYCLLRYEQNGLVDGYKHVSINYSGFKELLTGLFLPMKIETSAVWDKARPGNGGSLTTQVLMQDMHINDVPDATYVLEPTTGDYVMDNIRKQTYTYTPLDDASLDVAAQVASRTVRSKNFLIKRLLFILLFGLSVVIGAIIVRKRLSAFQA